ncbi:MAG: YjjG family noncanonical pyrimidine nucleotidase [Bacteroidota bacterium]|nr:YjjG family noncanonical pyrimidine nucleotidase [Bacteroidota bacterium]MDP3144067.1 YjjG family noncanonical pyrimidine nucleotidase [Bacteroidota bacterium]
MKNIKHIFFDLDDTLWDFEKNSIYILQQLFLEFDLKHKLKTDFENFAGIYKTVNLQLWQQYSKKEITKDYLRNRRFNLVFNQFNYDNYDENIIITEHYLNRAPKGKHLKEGCIETLNYLKQNYHLHIITNGFKEIQGIKIESCGLKDYFKNIIISEEHQLSKPEEKIFRLAEDFAFAKKEECVMIGDNFESDVEGALNAGWKAIYFAPENSIINKGSHIKNLSELKLLF